MLTLLQDAGIALIMAAVRAQRYLTRRARGHHEQPAQPCYTCIDQSANHPAGPVIRYTILRNNGQPECSRHPDPCPNT